MNRLAPLSLLALILGCIPATSTIAADSPLALSITQAANPHTLPADYLGLSFETFSLAGGGGTDYFADKEGNWWCAFFGNDNQAPFREMPAMLRVDFAKDGKISIADEQPAFVLQPGTDTHWRTTATSGSAK